MEKITYVGLERCDFVYHLANILSLHGSVLVADNSYNLDLIDTVSIDGTREPRELRNIIYASDVDIWDTDLSKFDFVIVYAGMAFDEKDFAGNKLVCVMPDYTKQSLERFKDGVLNNSTSDLMIIPRDYCNTKFTTKSLAKYLDIDCKEIIGHIEYNVQDMKSYISLTHNSKANIKSISYDMHDALAFVVSKVLDVTDSKRIKNLMKDATKIK